MIARLNILSRVTVVLDFKIYVYNLQNLKMIEVIETFQNQRGICAYCPSKEVCVLACPEKKAGVVRVVHFDKNSKNTLIEAHQSPIAALALNNEGTLIATASDKVRVLVAENIGNTGQNI